MSRIYLLVVTGIMFAGVAPNATVNAPMTSSTLNMTTTGTYTFNATATVTGDQYSGDDGMAPVNRFQIILGGSYTVGSGGAYPTLTAAVAAYNNSSGFTGPVTFTLLDASYSARTEGVGEVFPIVINSNAAAGANTLTIKPASGVTTSIIGSNSTGAIIQLNGADNVIIDGSNNGTASRNLTISNATTSTATAVIWLTSPSSSDGANKNIIKNCIITGNSSTNTGYGILTSSTVFEDPALAPNSNNVFQNNQISKVQLGITMFGPSTTDLETGNQIVSNTLGTATAGNGFSVLGVQVYDQDGIVISNNDIQNITGGTGGSLGIGVFDTKNAVVDKNKVHFMNYSDGSTAKLYGILVETFTFNTSGNPSGNQVSNNVVYDITSNGTSSFWSLSGIDDEGGYGDKFYFNSVYLTGQLSGASTAMAACFANGNDFEGNPCSTIDVRNNIFYMNGSSPSATPLYAHYTADVSNSGFTLNYNNLLSVVTGSAVGNIGRFNGIDYTTLANWKTASGEGTGSVNINPLFTSATNLSLLAGSPAIGAGATIAGITTDITGSTRNSPPSIGAFEDKVVVNVKIFLQGAYDAGLSRHKDVTVAWRDILRASATNQPFSNVNYGDLGYTGTESVAPSVFNSTAGTTDIVDWVLLELRTAAPPIATRAAFVLENGSIVDLDGSSPVSFKGVDSASYYVTIRHRNHLGIRTALKQLIDGSVTTPTVYDFTTAQNKAYKDVSITSNEAMMQDGSVFMMWAGNANADLYVRVTDQGFPFIEADAGYILGTLLSGNPNGAVVGYSIGDLNMDGVCRATDQGFPFIEGDAGYILGTVLSGDPNGARKEHK